MAQYDGGGEGTLSSPMFPGVFGNVFDYNSITKRRAQQKRRPIAPTIDLAESGGTGAPAFDPGAMAQRLASRQQELANAQQAAELDQLISRLQAEEESDMADFNSRLSAIPGRTAMQETGAREGALRSGAVGRRGLAGRGLSLSGIRAGFEGRNEGELLKRLGLIGQGATQESDAIRRAIERLKGDTQRSISEAQQKKLSFLQ